MKNNEPNVGKKILESNIDRPDHEGAGFDLILLIVIGIAIGWLVWKS